MAYHRGHVRGTKKERAPRQHEAYESALFRWRMFGPNGQIGPNTLSKDDEAWGMFGETTTTTTAA